MSASNRKNSRDEALSLRRQDAARRAAALRSLAPFRKTPSGCPSMRERVAMEYERVARGEFDEIDPTGWE